MDVLKGILQAEENQRELIAVLEEILENGLPRNRTRAEKILKKVKEWDKEETA